MDRRVVHSSGVEPQVFPWGQIKWLHSGGATGAEGLTVGEVVINPGEENPAHSHPNCEEVLYLVCGELIHTCGDEEPYHLKPGSCIRIPAGVEHNARCISSDAACMVVAYDSPTREVSGE